MVESHVAENRTAENRAAEDLTVLWLSAHPSPRSLSAHLREIGTDRLRRAGARVIDSDLYALQWDPVLRPEPFAATPEDFHPTDDVRRASIEGTLPADVVREQRKLREADAVVLQFPLWWYGMPAILKGWLDRVLHSGFAFGTDPATGTRLRFENGPFRGKRALVVLTLGDRPQAIGARGKSGELRQLLFGLLHGTLAYTGMDVLEPFAVPGADHLDPDGVARIEQQLLDRLDGLIGPEREAPIPYRPQFTGDYTEQWELVPEVLPGRTGLEVHVVGPEE